MLGIHSRHAAAPPSGLCLSPVACASGTSCLRGECLSACCCRLLLRLTSLYLRGYCTPFSRNVPYHNGDELQPGRP